MNKQEADQRDVEAAIITSDHHELTRLCGDLVNHSHHSKKAPSVQLLLPRILDVDAFKTTKRRTALHHAVRTRHGCDAVDVVELLLNAGADPNYMDCTGRTPLIACAERSREDWILHSDEVFSVDGADRRKPGEEKKEANSGSGSEEAPSVDDHVHYGAQVASCLLTVSPALIDARDNISNSSALHFAVRRNDMQLLEALLKFQPDLNLPDGSGRTPLAIAAELNYNHLLKVLLKAGSDVDCRFPDFPRDPLVSFFARRGLREVKVCVEYGAKDVLNDENKSSLDLASAYQIKAPKAPKEEKITCMEILQNAGFKTGLGLQVDADLEGIRVGTEGGQGNEKEGAGEETQKSSRGGGFFSCCFGKRKAKGAKVAGEIDAVEEGGDEDKNEDKDKDKEAPSASPPES